MSGARCHGATANVQPATDTRDSSRVRYAAVRYVIRFIQRKKMDYGLFMHVNCSKIVQFFMIITQFSEYYVRSQQ